MPPTQISNATLRSIRTHAIPVHSSMTTTVPMRPMRSVMASTRPSSQWGVPARRDRAAVEVVGPDLRGADDEAVRRRHQRCQDADADQCRQPRRKELNEQRGQRVVAGLPCRLQRFSEQRPGVQSAQAQHPQQAAEDGGQSDEAQPVTVLVQRPQLVTDVRQQAEFPRRRGR